MTDSMIERVARAICAANGNDPDMVPALGEVVNGIALGVALPLWRRYEAQARAAIEAMRTPTKEIIEAGGVAMDDALDGDWESDADGNRHDYSWIRSGAQTDVWRAMIDAALNEKAET